MLNLILHTDEWFYFYWDSKTNKESYNLKEYQDSLSSLEINSIVFEKKRKRAYNYATKTTILSKLIIEPHIDIELLKNQLAQDLILTSYRNFL